MGHNVNYLLGNQSQMLGADPESYRQQLIQQEQQRIAALPQQSQLGATVGGLLGRGIGNLATGNNFFEVTNPVLQKLTKIQDIYSSSMQEADPNDPLSFYTTLQKNFSDAGLGQQAMMAAQEAQRVELNQANIAHKLREKTVPLDEVVKTQLYNVALKEAGGNPEKAAIIYNDRIQSEKRGVSAAGATPAPGQVPLIQIKQAQDIVKEYTEKPQVKLQQIGVLSALGEGVKTNPTLLPKFQQESVRFAGDNQISAKEVAKSLGSLGFASDVVEGVNSFLEGKPTNVKIDKVLEGMRGLEKVYAKQYNTGRDKAAVVLDQGKIAPETRSAILPPAYNIKPQIVAPSVGAIVDKYQFLGGNPADPKNWKAL